MKKEGKRRDKGREGKVGEERGERKESNSSRTEP